MDDLISRKWLIECVEEGWIKFETEKDENKFIHLVRDTAPSAQPEIIRCKDCKYYEGVHNIQGHAPCTYWKSGGVLWNWFCSQAERWEDERNDI